MVQTILISHHLLNKMDVHLQWPIERPLWYYFFCINIYRARGIVTYNIWGIYNFLSQFLFSFFETKRLLKVMTLPPFLTSSNKMFPMLSLKDLLALVLLHDTRFYLINLLCKFSSWKQIPTANHYWEELIDILLFNILRNLPCMVKYF